MPPRRPRRQRELSKTKRGSRQACAKPVSPPKKGTAISRRSMARASQAGMSASGGSTGTHVIAQNSDSAGTF